jgi:copper homeostasis protein
VPLYVDRSICVAAAHVLPPQLFRIVLVEAAIESLADALAAERAGAQRVELCAQLAVGGITPSGGSIRAVLSKVRVPVHVIVRPREGGFAYSADEVDVMLHDIAMAKSLGAHGIVSGALRSDSAIDEDVCRALIEAAAPLPFTFHRAVDFTRDVVESLDQLVAFGVARVLTSGGAASAWEGREVIAELVRRAGRWLTIIAGGGVRAGHASELIRLTRVTELHLGPRVREVSPAPHGRLAVRIAKEAEANENEWSRLDADEVAAVVRAVS